MNYIERKLWMQLNDHEWKLALIYEYRNKIIVNSSHTPKNYLGIIPNFYPNSEMQVL